MYHVGQIMLCNLVPKVNLATNNNYGPLVCNSEKQTIGVDARPKNAQLGISLKVFVLENKLKNPKEKCHVY